MCESQPGSCIPAEGAKPISVGVSLLLGSRGSHHPPEKDVVNDASIPCWVARAPWEPRVLLTPENAPNVQMTDSSWSSEMIVTCPWRNDNYESKYVLLAKILPFLTQVLNCP